MKVFFATNELTYNTKFFQMVIASINSCLKNTTLTPYLIYDGDNELTEIHCEVIRWKFRFNENLIKHKGLSPSIAAFIRTEIPTICKHYNFEDNVVLYCDYDVIFLKDIDVITPKYIACSSEFNKTDFKNFNTGVMFMNIPNLLTENDNFMTFIDNNMAQMHVWDQTAYNLYYKNRIDILPIEYNWKPYWEWSDDIKILHFHGLKPVHTVEEFMAIPILKHLYNISTCFDKYKEIYNQYI